MKVPTREGVANQLVPESCVGRREVAGEALTGEVQAGLLSRERSFLRGADVVRTGGKQHRWPRSCKLPTDPAWSENQGMYRNTSHGNREIPWSPTAVMAAAGRVGKPEGAHR